MLDIYVDDPVTVILEAHGTAVKKVLFGHVDDVEEVVGKIKKITKNNLQILHNSTVHTLPYDSVAIDGTTDIEGAKFKLIKPEYELKVMVRNGVITG